MLLLVPLSIRRLRLCKAHLSRAIALVCMVLLLLLLVTVKSMASSSFLASPRFNASFYLTPGRIEASAQSSALAVRVQQNYVDGELGETHSPTVTGVHVEHLKRNKSNNCLRF